MFFFSIKCKKINWRLSLVDFLVRYVKKVSSKFETFFVTFQKDISGNISTYKSIFDNMIPTRIHGPLSSFWEKQTKKRVGFFRKII